MPRPPPDEGEVEEEARRWGWWSIRGQQRASAVQCRTHHVGRSSSASGIKEGNDVYIHFPPTAIFEIDRRKNIKTW